MKRIMPVILALSMLSFGAVRPAAAASCASPYVVQAGNTLSGIASACGVTLADLEAANPSLTTPDLIFPGQNIVIPQGPGIPNTGGNGTYTVQAGDSMSSISRQFGVTLAALLAANPAVTNADLIFPGNVINLPTSGPGIPNTGGSGTYTVQAGDTLSQIAAANNTTVAAIVALNSFITDPDFIAAGWVLDMP